MARNPKVEVGAINLRIPEDHARDYKALIADLVALKRGFRIHGDTYVAISYFDPERSLGVISKYTEIDLGGDWFDVDAFDTAAPEKIEEINIPGSLKPNHYRFYFTLNEDMHVFAFEVYAESRGLSVFGFEKYVKQALLAPEIQGKYGLVEADIIKDYNDIDRLLNLDDLKEVKITIRRPNPDDLDDDLAREIEERLRSQNGDEYQEILRSKDTGALKPNDRTRKLASVAAENGQVKTRNIENGVTVTKDSSESPLIEVTTYGAEESEMVTFLSVADKLLGKVRQARQNVRG